MNDKRTIIYGLSGSPRIQCLTDSDILKLLRKTRDQALFYDLFDALEQRVRHKIYASGGEIRRPRRIPHYVPGHDV